VLTYAPAKARDLVYLDFETEAIGPRPLHYPPKPVGCAVMGPSHGKPRYMAWGHPAGNNCKLEDVLPEFRQLWDDKRAVLSFYNAKFDLEVAQEHLGLPLPPPERIDDPMILAVFKDSRLYNYQQRTLLKLWLKKSQDERDELKLWIWAHFKEELGRKKGTQWGRYICKAPGDLVGRSRAIPDVELTRELREYLQDTADSMPEAYLRELKMIKVTLGMEKRGVPMDVEALERDNVIYTNALDKLGREIKEYVGMPQEGTIDGDDFANYLQRFAAPGKGWPVTAEGKLSTAAESLDYVLADRCLFGMVQYYGVLATSLHTHLQNWLNGSHNGRYHVTWNSIKGDTGKGTKTGRLSSNPNLQNIITADTCKKVEKDMPAGYPQLPRLRRYVKASSGMILIGRDFNQQEYRTFAHYAEGKLMEGYRTDPWMDIHNFVKDLINEIASTSLERKETKTLNFGTLYGLGVKKLAVKLKVDVDTARAILTAYFEALPETRTIRDQMDQFDRMGLPIQTLGGRIYYAEPPWVDKATGAVRRAGYKLVNLLVQGSCGDSCKESMISADEDFTEAELLLTVHDELVALCPEECWKDEMRVLKCSMEERSLPLEVPLLSEGYYGYNWEDLTDLERGQ